MNVKFNSGAVIDSSTTAAAGDELDISESLARELIASGIAVSLESPIVEPADTALAEMVDSDGTLAGDSDAKIASQKATKTYADAGDATAVHKTGNESIAGAKTFTGNVLMTALPTSDPHVANELWNNAGVLTISAG